MHVGVQEVTFNDGVVVPPGNPSTLICLAVTVLPIFVRVRVPTCEEFVPETVLRTVTDVRLKAAE